MVNSGQSVQNTSLMIPFPLGEDSLFQDTSMFHHTANQSAHT